MVRSAPSARICWRRRRILTRRCGGCATASPQPLGEAVLDQRAAAGIGNVIKSESLFMEGLDPWAPVSAFSDVELHAVVGRAAELLAANTGGGRRVTTGRRSPGEALWVYRRTGRPCRRCGTLIRGRRQGSQARTTYWCSSCQPSRSESAQGSPQTSSWDP